MVGSNGQPIFSVSEQGGGASLVLGTPTSGVITLSSAGDELEMTLAKGDSIIRLTSGGSGPELKVSGAGGSFDVKAGGSPSLSLAQGSEQIFKVESESSGPVLTVQKGGQQVRVAAFTDQTGVMVDAKGTHYQMGDIENIRGFVASRGDLPFAGLGAWGNDKYRVVIYNGTPKPVFLGGFDRETGKAGLFVGDENGNRIAEISPADGGSGKLKLFKASGDEIVTLGPDDGGADGASLKLGTGENTIVARATGSLATIIAKAGGKLAEMGVGEKSNGFVIAAQGKPIAALGDNGDSKPFLAIYNAGNPQPAISLGMATGTAMLRVFNPSGGLALVAGAVDGGRGSVKVYDDSKIMAGMEAKGGNSAIIYVSSNEHDVAGIYSEKGKGMVVVQGPKGQFAKLYSVADHGSLVLSDGKNPEASLGPTEINKNPGVRIFKQGSMVFAAGATNTGDGAAVVLSGGKLRAGLEARGSNGKVYVFAGDTEVASINSTDKAGEGMVVVRSPAGIAVATLGYGSAGGGNVTTSNPAGDGVFSAGYASDGAGEACVFRYTQAGTGRNGCIALGLPSAGMGK